MSEAGTQVQKRVARTLVGLEAVTDSEPVPSYHEEAQPPAHRPTDRDHRGEPSVDRYGALPVRRGLALPLF